MRKLFVLMVGFILLVLSGCSATPVRTQVLSKTENIVKVDVVQVKRTAISPLDGGVQLSIENLTNEVVEIDWNSSSLDGDSIVTDGQLFSQLNTMKPKTVIAPYSKAVKVVNKTSNIVIGGPYTASGQYTLELPAKLVLHITYNGNKEDYVIIDLIEKIK
jgi:PBP1b-binding outer membrane lipoprotein LpoB